MVYKDQIAYGETLADCIIKLFGYDINSDSKTDNNSSVIPENQEDNESGELTQAELIAKAQEAFNKAQEAQQEGNWAAYGNYLDQLEDYLNQLAG